MADSLRHPREMGSAEVNAFLSHLAVGLNVSPSTQNQALSALLVLYRELLERDLELDGVVRARTRRRLPVVLTPEEVRAVLQRLNGVEALVAGLLYGSGLRLMEALRLRVRDGKGGKDRTIMLPDGLGRQLASHLQHVRDIHRKDLADGWGRVLLPHALARKYPNAPVEWVGNGCFPKEAVGATRVAENRAAIIWIPASSKRLFDALCWPQVSANQPPATACGIRLLPICWSGARTSARSRSSWATAI